MLQLTWFEFFVRTIPESFFIVLAVHAFSKQIIDKKRFIIASLSYAALVFLVRMLPISYGIHTIINVITLIAIAYYINKITVAVSIRSGIITLVLLYVCELLKILVIQYFLHLNIDNMLNNVYVKTLYSLPSLVLIAAISSLCYYFLVMRKRKQDV